MEQKNKEFLMFLIHTANAGHKKVVVKKRGKASRVVHGKPLYYIGTTEGPLNICCSEGTFMRSQV